MVILRQETEFVISGDIEEIKAEIDKGLSDEPAENEKGVFLGKFYLEIVWKNFEALTIPDWGVRLNRGHILVDFPPAGVSFFKNEDENLYDAVISYITNTAIEELNKI